MEGSESVPRKGELKQMVIQVSFGDRYMAAFTEDGRFPMTLFLGQELYDCILGALDEEHGSHAGTTEYACGFRK